ncbi:MAG: hypothetical protein ACOX2M_03475 [Fastidiosipilaceae bacterium]|jgi:hypothetical protein
MQYVSIRKATQDLKSREDRTWSWISEGFIRDLVRTGCLPILKRGNRSLICLNTIEEELPNAIEQYRALQNEKLG